MLPSSYAAASVSDLIADINAANAAGGVNTIALTAPTTSPYALTATNNTNGATGLPVVAANDNLTIVGNGDAIERSTVSGTPYFRLFDVAAGASLTLGNLTLKGGVAYGAGVAAEGGAIYSQGNLVLNGVTVQNNQALGVAGPSVQNDHSPPVYGSPASGGGLYVAAGTATLTNVTLSSNTAQGGQHGILNEQAAGNGGGLYVAGGTVTLANDTVETNTASLDGGGLYVAGGTVSSSNDTVESNTAGYGAGLDVAGGAVASSNDTVESNTAENGGGGLYVNGGTMSLANDTVESNTAENGGGLFALVGTVTLTNCTVQGNSAVGTGGGFIISSEAHGYLDSFTVANTINNHAKVNPNISGRYIL